MPKRFNVLDSLNIASPCSADWDEMVGNEQVRLCRDCSLYVHDLAKITRKDAVKLVAASKGKLCVRYYRRPDGALHTASHAEPLVRIKRRLSRIAAGAFTATLSLAASAAAQSAQTAERDQQAAISPAIANARTRAVNPGWQTASLAGTVTDPNQAVVTGATVTLVNDRGEEQATASNDDGTYQFQAVEAGTYKLKIESPGFVPYQQEKVVLESGREQRADAALDVGEILGGVVMLDPDTPLVRAIWNDSMDEVRNLLAIGVDVNVLDKNTNSTALAEAVASGKLELVLSLLGAGADVNMRNNSGQTALMRLDGDATVELVRTLIDAGARINLKDEYGDSALMVAAAMEKADVLQALLDAGAKVNSRNKDGKTALMIAAADGHVDSVKALLLAGADVWRKDNDGNTVLKYAREQENDEIVATLLAYGAVD